MTRVLLVASTTGYQTRAFAEAAPRCGVELALATDRCHILDNPWGDSALALRFEDPHAAARAIAASPEASLITGIAAVGDHPTFIASLAAEALGLPFHPSAAVAASSNKFLARERFRAVGLPVPEYFRLPLDADPRAAGARFPCVLKPLGLSASRGVIRANDPAEFRAAFERIRALLLSPEIARNHRPEDRFIQVEEFLPGREFALEGIVTRGRLRPLALFDKPDPLDGPFFEETIYFTPSRQPASIQTAILETASAAIAALGLTHGPIHAEMRVDPRGVWMLEVAARPIGGLCAKALPGLEEAILSHAAGRPEYPIELPAPASGVMMIPIPREGVYASVEGVELAAAIPGIREVAITAKPGQHLQPLPEGHSYLGFLFAAGPTPSAVESSLRTAHSSLRFEIRTALPITAV